MCGICGIYSKSAGSVEKAKIEFMRDIMSQQGSDGYGIPPAVWMRTKYKELIKRILLFDKARSRGFYDYNFLEQCLDNFFRTKQGNEHRIRSLLVLELRHLIFIDGAMQPSDSLYDLL